MARTPIVYRWDDPGAPDLSAVMPTSNDKKKLFVHTVLRACLVDGYGGKPAAGWVMPHEEIVSNGCRFVLSNAANSGSLLYEGGAFSGGASNFNDGTVWACSAVPTMDAPINAWSYKTKYEERSSAVGDVFHRFEVYDFSKCDAWVVIANENTVIFVPGVAGVDFNLTSGAVLNSFTTTLLIAGAMHNGAGGVIDPEAGNFYIAGGDDSAYSGYSWFTGINNVLTSIVGITGLEKTEAHTYSYKKPAFHSTYSLLSAWLPVPILYMQYGPSAPDGNSASRVHFAVALPSIRKLLLHPYNTVSLNEFMTNNGFEYGKEFSYRGAQWVALKAVDDVVQMFSLDAAEWGA